MKTPSANSYDTAGLNIKYAHPFMWIGIFALFLLSCTISFAATTPCDSLSGEIRKLNANIKATNDKSLTKGYRAEIKKLKKQKAELGCPASSESEVPANGATGNGPGASQENVLERSPGNGLAANGLSTNGLSANGLGTNGLSGNGLGANGLGANGLGANGLGANGLGANGLGLNGLDANGLGGAGGAGAGAGGAGAGAATYTFGPYDVYVSVQQPVQTIFSGGATGWADEGRVLDINIKNIQGPILINPKNFHLDGPVCPTYDARGRRTPEDPAPNATANFSGSIKLDPDNIPAPGTVADAQFSGKDDGYWTKCSANLKTYYNQTVTVSMKINSLKLKLARGPFCVLKGATTTITVTERFPAAGTGTITWASLDGKVRVNGNDAKCDVTYIASGDDRIVGTLTVSGVSFRDTVRVKAAELAFAEARYNYLVPVDDKIDLKSLLTATSTRTDLEWTIGKNGGADAAVAGPDPKVDKKTLAGGDVIIVKVKVTGTACAATTTLKFYKLALAIPNNSTCDGTPLPFKIIILPADAAISAALIGTAAGLVPKSKTSVRSLGNIAGTTVLEFEALDAAFNTKVKNMIWYSNQADNCNSTSEYKLWAEGAVNGKAVKTDEFDIISDAGAACVNGSARVTQRFTGVPGLRVGQEAAGLRRWFAFISDMGTFARAPQGATNITCARASQYYAETVAEEDYHVGQIDGTNGRLCADMWLVANVYDPRLNIRCFAGTRADAITAASEAFWDARDAEYARCNAMFVYPADKRCAMEKEAKIAVRASYNGVLKCTYPRCR